MCKKRYYVLAPAETVSGGPELAHQMCAELLAQGCNAWMYYIQGGLKSPVDVPADARYTKYGTEHVRDLEEVEKEGSVAIVSEGIAMWALALRECEKVLWWMSVDNYVSAMNAMGKDRFDEIREEVSLHLVQSQYAYQYLLDRGISPEKILYLSDYIGEGYGKTKLPSSFRQDIALYNPKKGLEEIKPLIEKTGWLKWIPLFNLTEEQMISIMGIAKVYVDFGHHPGKDRIPREAAASGCCVITNRKGSAAFYEDVPIPDCYKIEDVHKEYDRIGELLKDICAHWEEHSRQFEEYRKVIASERQKFSEDVRAFVNIVETGEIKGRVGAICINRQGALKELSFTEILLDETLVQGDLWVLKDALKDAGGINYRLKAKRGYELLIRIAKAYRVLQIGEENSSELIQEAGLEYLPWMEDAGENWVHLEPEKTAEDDDKEVEENLKTDCYLLGRYKNELLAIGCFDDAVLGIFSAGGEPVMQYMEGMIAGEKDFYDIYDCTQPILIYRGGSLCYSILDIMAGYLGCALEKHGQKVEYFDTSKQKMEDLIVCTKRRYKAVIGMQTRMFSLKWKDGGFIHDVIDAPKYQFVFDHPIWFQDSLRQAPRQLCVLTPDRNYAEFTRDYFECKARFLPLGGKEEVCGETDKIYDISFLGSWGEGPLESLRAVRKMDKKRCYLLNRYILNMRKDLDTTPEQAMKKALNHYGAQYTKEEFIQLLYQDGWVISGLAHYYRNKVIKVLLDAGICLHVFGDSWKKSPMWGHPGLIWHEEAIGQNAMEVYAGSKISLNIMKWHKDAFTERIANAMLQKSVVVTDKTDYIKENFVDGEELLIFDLAHMDELPDQIKTLLADEKKREEIAENGYRKAAKYHTWDRRAGKLLEWIEEDSWKDN